jgi:hypothetical protein
VVHGPVAQRPLDGGHDRPGCDLHDPGQLAAPLRHVRPGLRLDASDGVRGVHPGILRNRRRPQHRGRLRDRLRLPSGLRGRVLVSTAPHLRVRRRLRMGRADGVRLRGGHGRRLGRSLGLLLRRRRHRPQRSTSTGTAPTTAGTRARCGPIWKAALSPRRRVPPRRARAPSSEPNRRRAGPPRRVRASRSAVRRARTTCMRAETETPTGSWARVCPAKTKGRVSAAPAEFAMATAGSAPP